MPFTIQATLPGYFWFNLNRCKNNKPLRQLNRKTICKRNTLIKENNWAQITAISRQV